MIAIQEPARTILADRWRKGVLRIEIDPELEPEIEIREVFQQRKGQVTNISTLVIVPDEATAQTVRGSLVR